MCVKFQNTKDNDLMTFYFFVFFLIVCVEFQNINDNGLMTFYFIFYFLLCVLSSKTSMIMI